MAMTTDGEARELARLVRLRRDLHRIPETGYDLDETFAYVEGVLGRLSCVVERPCRSCVTAWFDFGAAETVAIRADMDALPIEERSGVGFRSTHPGHMHACGHDAHMAMALVAAEWVDGMAHGSRCGLRRNVLFVFQPAEETSGGALSVCESGVLRRHGVTSIFGFHVWPDLPGGLVASRPGPLLARSSEVTLTVRGESRHIAKCLALPEREVRDANLACFRFAVAASDAMAGLAADEPCLCRFGRVAGGVVRNAIAGECVLEGSLRVFSDAMFARAREALEACAREACAPCGCEWDLHFSEGNPPVVNDPELYGLVERALAGINACVAEAAADGVTMADGGLARVDDPLLIAEDFASYQLFVPGVFLLLGTGTGIALHSDEFVLDERVLLRGVEAYRRLLLA